MGLLSDDLAEPSFLIIKVDLDVHTPARDLFGHHQLDTTKAAPVRVILLHKELALALHGGFQGLRDKGGFLARLHQ